MFFLIATALFLSVYQTFASFLKLSSGQLTDQIEDNNPIAFET